MLKKHFLLILFLILYFFIIAYKLIFNPTPFYDWDEAINVQVSKEVIEKMSLVPLWQGNPWLDKPPLPFLLFGIVMKFTPFVSPEISLRFFSLLLSLISLIFIYTVFYKASKDKFIAFFTVLLTSFTPIFLQRSQIVNLDVFLLIGWLGYLLFVQNYWVSLFFLAFGVFSKSLLGFYPIVILTGYYIYLLNIKKINFIKFKKLSLRLFSHVTILSIWYFVMVFIFKEQFLHQHIIETHFRRVTASLESHFGQRTYYLDLMFEQLGLFTWLSFLGFGIIIWRFIAKKLTNQQLTNLLYLFPLFVFLNLTKTKIFWYLYPAIPQFAFLAVLPLSLVNKKKVVFFFFGFIIIILIFYQNFIKTNFFTTFYSQPEDHYRLALYSKNYCDALTVLVGKETRDATKTLEDLALTISSTKQWGDHPSIVYYFGKKVNFEYDEAFLKKTLAYFTKKRCLVVGKNDLDIPFLNKQFLKQKNFDSLVLLYN